MLTARRRNHSRRNLPTANEGRNDCSKFKQNWTRDKEMYCPSGPIADMKMTSPFLTLVTKNIIRMPSLMVWDWWSFLCKAFIIRSLKSATASTVPNGRFCSASEGIVTPTKKAFYTNNLERINIKKVMEQHEAYGFHPCWARMLILQDIARILHYYA